MSSTNMNELPASPTAAGSKALPMTKKPEDTAFKQQRLPAWQPVMSPRPVIGCFGVTSVAFVIIGAVILVESNNIIEVKERYDHSQACPWDRRNASYGYACEPLNLTITIPKAMKNPLIYYQVDNFYQNHRRYAKSRSDLQLSGDSPAPDTITDCDPFLHPGQYNSLPDQKSVNFQGQGDMVDMSTVTYSPCGLIAWSMFNDTFRISRRNESGGADEVICNGDGFTDAGEPLGANVGKCSKKGIAWPSDPGVKYAASPSAATVDRSVLTNRGWPNTNDTASEPLSKFAANGWYMGEEGHKIPSATDEDLMVWMRLASLSTFRKLYRRVDQEIPKGVYNVVILQRYDVESFGGKKYFVMTTTSWIGGRNYFLGGLYIATGFVCFVLFFAFMIKFTRSVQRVGSL
jgi:hypothetical protein